MRGGLQGNGVWGVFNAESICGYWGGEAGERLRPEVTVVPIPFLPYPGLADALTEAKILGGKVDITLDDSPNSGRSRVTGFAVAVADSRTRRCLLRPHGPIAAIGPSNLPAHLPTRPPVPAPLPANTHVLQPPSHAPRLCPPLPHLSAQAPPSAAAPPPAPRATLPALFCPHPRPTPRERPAWRNTRRGHRRSLVMAGSLQVPSPRSPWTCKANHAQSHKTTRRKARATTPAGARAWAGRAAGAGGVGGVVTVQGLSWVGVLWVGVPWVGVSCIDGPGASVETPTAIGGSGESMRPKPTTAERVDGGVSSTSAGAAAATVSGS